MKKGHLGFGLVKGVDKILPICGWASIAINFCFFLRLDEEWYEKFAFGRSTQRLPCGRADYTFHFLEILIDR